MDKLIFQEAGDLERIQHLKNNADSIIEAYSYDRVLTPEEIAEKEAEFAQTHIAINVLDAEKAEYLANINEKIKGKQKAAKKTIAQIKSGREESTENVFVIHDETEQRVGIYNYRGELISERPMNQNERQHRMRFSTEDYEVSVTGKDGKKKVV
jgi:flagellar hook-basal body complex protein FliE